MQRDYSQLLRHLQDGIVPEAHFYSFFEDSLNQFISANSGSFSPVNKCPGEQKNCLDYIQESSEINTDKQQPSL